MGADDMKARTPAPEGEASLWGCADGNGIDPRLVFRDRPTAEQVAADTDMVVQPLYASPVVPVSREKIAAVLASAFEDYRLGAAAPGYPLELFQADAIIAALRPTDTGRE
jgi:hypothetical protein